jgi:hypothetical protein
LNHQKPTLIGWAQIRSVTRTFLPPQSKNDATSPNFVQGKEQLLDPHLSSQRKTQLCHQTQFEAFYFLQPHLGWTGLTSILADQEGITHP